MKVGKRGRAPIHLPRNNNLNKNTIEQEPFPQSLYSQGTYMVNCCYAQIMLRTFQTFPNDFRICDGADRGL